MPSIEEKNDGYEIKNLLLHERIKCPDNDTELERIGPEQVKLIIKKGKIIKP